MGDVESAARMLLRSPIAPPGHSTRKRRLCTRPLAALVALVAVALALSPPAGADGTSHLVVELDPTSGAGEIDPCNGEWLTLSGRIVLSFHEVATGSSGSHVNGNGVLQGVTATSVESGATYRFVGASPFVFNSNGASTVTIKGTRRLVGQGNAGDFILRTEFHVTVDANGDQTALVLRDTLECL